MTVSVTERGASLGDANATAVWQRVGDLVSVDAPEPPRVVVDAGANSTDYQPTRFQRSFGATNFTRAGPALKGTYNRTHDEVRLFRSPAMADAELEARLAHEFAHVYQWHADVERPEIRNVFARMATWEGAAEYVEWQYADRYLDYGPEAAEVADLATDDPLDWRGAAAYYYGAQWVRTHADADAPLASTFADPPRAAEEVLRGLGPGSEQAPSLTVEAESGAYGIADESAVEPTGEDRLRAVLQAGLPRDQAARATAGWGASRIATFKSELGNGHAWVVRWDEPAAATGFRERFGDFQANVSEPLRVEAVDDETTVVFSGREAFVENATVSGTAGNVTVSARN